MYVIFKIQLPYYFGIDICVHFYIRVYSIYVATRIFLSVLEDGIAIYCKGLCNTNLKKKGICKIDAISLIF